MRYLQSLALLSACLATLCAAYVKPATHEKRSVVGRITQNQFNPRKLTRTRRALLPRRSTTYCPDYMNQNDDCVAACDKLSNGFSQSEIGGCSCDDPKEIFGDTCVLKCTKGFSRDANTGNCSVCTGNSEVVDGSCVPKCDKGFTRDSTSGQCTVCTSDKEVVAGSCVAKCTKGFSRDTNTGDCSVCNADSEVIGGSCVAKCDKGFTRDPTSGQCTVCTSDKEVVSGSCVAKCTGSTIRNGAGNCVVACSPDRLNNGFLQAESGDCVCPGFTTTNKKCVASCGPNFTQNAQTGACSCDTRTYFQTSTGTCAKKCGSGYTQNTATGACLCPSSMYNTGSACVAKCSNDKIRTGYTQNSAGGCTGTKGMSCSTDDITCTKSCNFSFYPYGYYCS